MNKDKPPKNNIEVLNRIRLIINRPKQTTASRIQEIVDTIRSYDDHIAQTEERKDWRFIPLEHTPDRWEVDYVPTPNPQGETNMTTITDVREEIGSAAFDEYVNNIMGYPTIKDVDPEEILDAYQGQWDDPAEYVEEWTEEVGDLAGLPDHIKYHIDWKGIWRDWDMSGEFYHDEDNGVVWRMT